MLLPEDFLDDMRRLLGTEFEPFLESYEQTPHYGFRINPLKVTPAQWNAISPFPCSPLLWIPTGYRYNREDNPGKDAYYHAGMYYLQEPSAMTPADRLPVEPGDRVLDLCAAPGGKATALGAKLQGRGLLVANDLSVSRANALLKNIELAGIANAVVTAESPAKLSGFYAGFFDKILVDAPCSGQGMFRRDCAMLKSYREKDSTYYQPLQREILSEAFKMLRPGGLLMYSTCTFSVKENEDNIVWLLNTFSDCVLEPMQGFEGFSICRVENEEIQERWKDGGACRIWPHRMTGEGHFLALIRKLAQDNMDEYGRFEPEGIEHVCTESGRTEPGQIKPGLNESGRKVSGRKENGRKESGRIESGPGGYLNTGIPEDFKTFMKKCSFPYLPERLMLLKDSLYLLPEHFTNPKGLRILRSGLLLGSFVKGRFSPSQAFAMTLKKEQYEDCIDLSRDDIRVMKYLKGETIEIDAADRRGWQLVCVDGFPLGWGKAVQGNLKNKYAVGWRI